jgi:pentatricopeptide repeat protein
MEWLKEQNWWTFSVLDYNLMIAAYGKIGEYDKVERMIQRMKDAGFNPNVATYTSLIEAYGRKRMFSEAEDVLEKMAKEGPKPTQVTYQTMIGALVKVRKREGRDLATVRLF